MGGELIQVLDAGASPRTLAKDLRERSAQSGVRTQSSYRAVRAGQNCVWCCQRRSDGGGLNCGQLCTSAGTSAADTKSKSAHLTATTAHILPPASSPRNTCLRIKTQCHTPTVEE